MTKEEQKLNDAVDAFSNVMKERLFQKCREGFKGWDDPELVPDFELECRMLDKVHEEYVRNKVDIANFAMMLWYRKNMGLSVD